MNSSYSLAISFGFPMLTIFPLSINSDLSEIESMWRLCVVKTIVFPFSLYKIIWPKWDEIACLSADREPISLRAKRMAHIRAGARDAYE